MQQRFLYIWFPRLATDRNTNTPPDGTPFAVTRSDHLGVFLTGCNEVARSLGLHPAMRLADARASVPELVTETANPDGERRLLEDMVRAGERFSP